MLCGGRKKLPGLHLSVVILFSGPLGSWVQFFYNRITTNSIKNFYCVKIDLPRDIIVLHKYIDPTLNGTTEIKLEALFFKLR